MHLRARARAGDLTISTAGGSGYQGSPRFRDHLFHVSYPTDAAAGSWSIRGTDTWPRGPYLSEAAAITHRWQTLQRWKARAVRQGGFVICQTRARWLVVLHYARAKYLPPLTLVLSCADQRIMQTEDRMTATPCRVTSKLNGQIGYALLREELAARNQLLICWAPGARWSLHSDPGTVTIDRRCDPITGKSVELFDGHAIEFVVPLFDWYEHDFHQFVYDRGNDDIEHFAERRTDWGAS